MSTPLNEIGKEARATNLVKGFLPPVVQDWEESIHKIPAFIALIHSEASEALEAFRNDDAEGFEEELADIIIRTLDLGYGLGVDMDALVARKLAANKDRAHRHGGKRL
jgi:NTP pyrophosphatase (non-canonical NTP hydrolase)